METHRLMGMTYFRRFRMEMDLLDRDPVSRDLAGVYELVPFDEGLIRDHAQAKYASFHEELDANVFPCLGTREGCLRLMREIASRASFVPEATWLIRYRDSAGQRGQPVGTIQGLRSEGWGAIQNIGVVPRFRGRGLGSALIDAAADGFREAGLSRVHLEVTSDNTDAVRLYERVGFRRAKVLYKATEVAGAAS